MKDKADDEEEVEPEFQFHMRDLINDKNGKPFEPPRPLGEQYLCKPVNDFNF